MWRSDGGARQAATLPGTPRPRSRGGLGSRRALRGGGRELRPPSGAAPCGPGLRGHPHPRPRGGRRARLGGAAPPARGSRSASPTGRRRGVAGGRAVRGEPSTGRTCAVVKSRVRRATHDLPLRRIRRSSAPRDAPRRRGAPSEHSARAGRQALPPGDRERQQALPPGDRERQQALAPGDRERQAEVGRGPPRRGQAALEAAPCRGCGPGLRLGQGRRGERAGHRGDLRLRGALGDLQDDGRGRGPQGRRLRATVYRYFPGGRDELVEQRHHVGVPPILPAALRRGAGCDLSRGGHGARPHVRPPGHRRARGAPARPRDRTRAPVAQPHGRGASDHRADRRLPPALPRGPWRDAGGRPRGGGRLPGPHGAVLHLGTGPVGPERSGAGVRAGPGRAPRRHGAAGPAGHRGVARGRRGEAGDSNR